MSVLWAFFGCRQFWEVHSVPDARLLLRAGGAADGGGGAADAGPEEGRQTQQG